MEVIDQFNENQSSSKNTENPDFKPWGMEVNQFCMLMHFAQFAGYIIPLAGLILPIVMWASNKDQSELVDAHGKNILNWIISSAIYIVIGIVLIVVIIGIPILVAVGICSLIFTIIGGLKANDGYVYVYPLAITFLK